MTTPAEDRARQLAVAQDFGAEALDLNRRLVAANPTDAASRTRLGRCLLEAGRLDEAEAEYREVLRLDPRNRIGAGGLEAIELLRHPQAPPKARVRSVRAGGSSSRVSGSASAPGTSPGRHAEPTGSTSSVPQTFTGFDADAFSELARCGRREVQGRFAPRVLDLIRRVNALPSSVELAGIREPGKRQLFRKGRAEVHPDDAHWNVFNHGGRWEPQLNIGMYGGHVVGNYLRIGLGFNLTDDSTDTDRTEGITRVRGHLRRLQELLASPTRSLFLGWMVKENGRIQHNDGPPRLELRDPSEVTTVVCGFDPDRTTWVFFGKWLSPDQPDEAAILSDPVSLVRMIDRVLAGITPLYRALFNYAD